MKETNIINNFKTLTELENYRAEINELCNHRAEFIRLCEDANELTHKSFGYIKEAFEAISSELFKTNEGKKIINKYIKTIKENKNLATLHSIHENIRKASKDTDIDFFIKSITETKKPSNQKNISEDVKKIGRVLSEGYLYLGNSTKDLLPVNENNLTTLSAAVNYIVENKKNNKNIVEYSDAVKIIKNYINSGEEKQNVFERVDLDDMSSKLIKEFNDKYKDKLTDEEIYIIKEITNSKDKESLFNQYKNSCITKITEAKNNFENNGDKVSVDRLNAVLEQINNKNYSLDTIAVDICSLFELSNIF